LPLVAIEVRFLHGVDGDPKEKPGLAEFVSDMVDEGTKGRSATKFAEEVETWRRTSAPAPPWRPPTSTSTA